MDTTIRPKRPLLVEHPTFDTRKVWVLLWSKTQGMLHIETLEAMLSSHMQAFAGDLEMLYVPLLIGDREVIDQAANAVTPKVAERYNAKHRDKDGFIPYEALP